ncbi:MAG: 50S ribosomal protein L25 [Lachnospiraceae bacterium]|nr:50S ribosomal protein L25 [Lachnospiraceae bacterium]MCR5500385.1 50S ribosomal protein L25 [Acetatifactor sp.]
MNTLKVQRRDMAKKAKELRREGFVTGTLFGKELNGSIPIIIEKKEAERIHRECFKGSQLFVELDGKKYDVLLKEVDYDAMKRQILELDFQALVKGEKVHSVAEIVLHNKEKIVAGILEQLLEEVAYKATPEHLVERIDLDCSDWKIGDVIKVSDLEIAKNADVEITTHMDSIVASVLAPKNAEPEAAQETTEAAE